MKTADTVGYAHLVQTMGLCVLSMPRPATTKAVKRVIASETGFSASIHGWEWTFVAALIHHTLCRSGALANHLLLPVSVAMKHEEARYLEALQGFSKPTREHWRVRWIDAEDFSFDFTGDAAIYRYWDATACVAFTLEMAKRALAVELRDETLFLQRYDAIFQAVNDRYDVRGSLLTNLVMMCLDNPGIVSRDRRKQYKYDLKDEVFDYIETITQRELTTSNVDPITP
jgi:hypothetical protein